METLCKIRDIYRLLYTFEREFQERYGIGFNEGLLLCTIEKAGSCASGQLAYWLGLSSSNSSKVIVQAEKKGLIQRNIGQKDKRQMYFSLTAAGQEQLNTIRGDKGAAAAADTLAQINVLLKAASSEPTLHRSHAVASSKPRHTRQNKNR